MWALVHCRNFKRGVDEWFENSDLMIEALNGGDADAINSTMGSAVAKQVSNVMKERINFEIIANACNILFKTRVLPSKVFDRSLLP